MSSLPVRTTRSEHNPHVCARQSLDTFARLRSFVLSISLLEGTIFVVLLPSNSLRGAYVRLYRQAEHEISLKGKLEQLQWQPIQRPTAPFNAETTW